MINHDMMLTDAAGDGRLPVSIATEDGQVRTGLTAAELATALAGLGRSGNRFAVVERLDGEEQHFIQARRVGAGDFAVEYRDGGPARHFATRCGQAGQVAELFLGWIDEVPGWSAAHLWEPVVFEAVPELDPETRRTAEDQARLLIRCGFHKRMEVARSVSEFFDPTVRPVSIEQADAVVAGPWRERLAEQKSWPRVTDPDRIAAAFEELESAGITARMNFACCGNRGHGEIGAEAAPGARGYVFFHSRATEHAARGHALGLCLGAFRGSGTDVSAVAGEVARALRRHGLTVDERPDRLLDITPIDWRKRLPR
jgi:hypothetical protein